MTTLLLLKRFQPEVITLCGACCITLVLYLDWLNVCQANNNKKNGKKLDRLFLEIIQTNYINTLKYTYIHKNIMK